MKFRVKFFVGVCCLLLLSGCMVGPNYRPPVNHIPECWSEPCCIQEPVRVDWWQEFHDPLLTSYMAQLMKDNRDLKSADLAICRAKALRQIIASQLYPQLNLMTNATRTYFSKNGPLFEIGIGETDTTPGLPFEIQIPQLQNIYTIMLNLSWNLDPFGKVRREVEAAEGFVGSTIEQRNDLLIHLMAELASSYVDLRAAQNQGVLIEENICFLEQELAMSRENFQKGLVDRIDVENHEVSLAREMSLLGPLIAEIYRNIFAISVLTGKFPEVLQSELLPLAPMPTPSLEIACGLRTDLLRRRPDVRRAERELAASVATIGVAMASFLPSLNINADVGLQSLNLSNLFQAHSKTWAIGATSVAPVFQGGRLVGGLVLSQAQARIAMFTYQQTVLTALQESESALIAFSKQRESTQYLEQVVQSQGEIAKLTKERFQNGFVNKTALLESLRQSNQAQRDWVESDRTLLLDLVQLYTALGGGWEVRCP